MYLGNVQEPCGSRDVTGMMNMLLVLAFLSDGKMNSATSMAAQTAPMLQHLLSCWVLTWYVAADHVQVPKVPLLLSSDMLSD
jgi:hypothetical protein